MIKEKSLEELRERLRTAKRLSIINMIVWMAVYIIFMFRTTLFLGVSAIILGMVAIAWSSVIGEIRIRILIRRLRK